MKLIVTDEILMIYKDVVDNYTVHTVTCSYHLTERCDCGLVDKVRKLIDLSKETMKVMDEG